MADATRFCPNCGAEVSPRASVCLKCSQQLAPATAQTPPSGGPHPSQGAGFHYSQPKTGNFWSRRSAGGKILLVVVGLFVLGGIGSALSGGTKTTTTTTVATVAQTPAVAAPVVETLPAAPATTKSSFVDGVLTTPEMIIKITDMKTIPAGATGNEYGKKPVIAFWYETTNLTGDQVSPMNWIYVISAYQDNNPNAVNELKIGPLPDDRFLDSQLETIKKGGTVANAVAYELDDETTPVNLVASEDFGSTETGRMTYNLK